MFTVVLTDLTVFDKEKKDTKTIKVIKDGTHTLTNSDIKRFVKSLKNTNIVPIEKSKIFLNVDFDDIYKKPLVQVIQETYNNEKIYRFESEDW